MKGLLSVCDYGLIGKVNLRPCSRENLDGISAGNIWGKFELVVDFEHGENVRKRGAIGKPKASRCGIRKPAGKDGGTTLLRMARSNLAREIASAVRVLKSNANAGRFIAGSGCFAGGFQHGFTSVMEWLPAWNTGSI
jgi:hypothetical protein